MDTQRTVFALVFLLLMFALRASLAFLYTSIPAKGSRRWPWALLALLWGVWSLPFWLVGQADLRDLIGDLRRYWLFKTLLDRSNVLNLFFVFILAQALASLAVIPLILGLLYLGYGGFRPGHVTDPWSIALILLFLDATIIGLVYVWGRDAPWVGSKGLGLSTRGLGRNIIIGLVLGIAFTMGSVGLDLIMGILLPRDLPGWMNPDNRYFATRSVWDLVLLAIGAAVLAPMGEELYFRGYLYSGLSRKYAPLAVFLLSSAYFSLGHMNLVMAPAILLAGLALVYVRHRTQSIVPTFIMHSMNNLFAVLFLFFVH